MTDVERCAALMDVLGHIVDPGGDMRKYAIDPAKLPPGLMTFEQLDERFYSKGVDLPDWKDR